MDKFVVNGDNDMKEFVAEYDETSARKRKRDLDDKPPSRFLGTSVTIASLERSASSPWLFPSRLSFL